MKKPFTYILLMLSLLLCSCGSNSSNDVAEIDDVGSYDETMEAQYDNLLDEYWSETEEYAEALAYYEEAIQYYENLCDYYGYQTYEGVYYPELWCNYVEMDDGVYHNDWLCPNLGETYYTSANPEFEETYRGISKCELCGNTEICFLDVDEGIIHSQKRHLDLGTEDFVSLDTVYRFVSAERAIENGFEYCDSCDFE